MLDFRLSYSRIVDTLVLILTRKCIFSDDLKFAEVSSLFKRSDALNKLNYRPESVLIALSKINEKAVSIQATDHFNSIFRPYGFQKRI